MTARWVNLRTTRGATVTRWPNLIYEHGCDRHDCQHPERPPLWAEHLHTHAHRLEGMSVTEQEDLDALAAKIAADNDAIKSSLADLEAKVAAGGTVVVEDLTALRAAVSGLDDTATSAPQPTPPTP